MKILLVLLTHSFLYSWSVQVAANLETVLKQKLLSKYFTSFIKQSSNNFQQKIQQLRQHPRKIKLTSDTMMIPKRNTNT